MAIRLRKRKNYTAYEVYWIDPETKQRRSKHFYDKKEARDFDKLVLLELEKYREGVGVALITGGALGRLSPAINRTWYRRRPGTSGSLPGRPGARRNPGSGPRPGRWCRARRVWI